MRVWYFRNSVTVSINFLAWFTLHMLIAFSATLLPRHLFHEGQWMYRLRKWEKGGTLYQQLFNVKKWKNRLPDGAVWFRSGYAKKHLHGTDSESLNIFVKETCRGELTHWIVIALSPLFFLWNKRVIGFFMIVYAFAANLPCIIVQRYNRPLLLRILTRRREHTY